jgi:hypothetical protein
MAERTPDAVLIILLGYLLYIALSDLLQLVEGSGRPADIYMLPFCVIVSVGWIIFFGGLLLSVEREDTSADLHRRLDARPDHHS